jgi:hypothetical protein
MKVTVTGLKFFEGVIDGKTIASGRFYTECKLHDPKGNSKGIFTEEWKVTSELIKRLMHLPVPFDADLQTERVGNGKETREMVIDLLPIGQKSNLTDVKKAA